MSNYDDNDDSDGDGDIKKRCKQPGYCGILKPLPIHELINILNHNNNI